MGSAHKKRDCCEEEVTGGQVLNFKKRKRRWYFLKKLSKVSFRYETFIFIILFEILPRGKHEHFEQFVQGIQCVKVYKALKSLKAPVSLK